MKIDYNKFWEDNIASHSFHPSVRLRNAFIIQSLKKLPFQSIIDVGCGDAELIKVLKTEFIDKVFSGVDISEDIINRDKSVLPDVNFSLGNLGDGNFHNADNYDVVICSEVIEHIDDWKTVMSNLSKLTKPKGYVILTTQSGKRYKSDLNIGHVKHFNLDELEIEFQKLGFQKISSYKKGWPFYNLQKWLYEKIEGKAQSIQHGELTPFRKLIFQVAYLLFSITPKSHYLGPQIFMIFQKQ